MSNYNIDAEKYGEKLSEIIKALNNDIREIDGFSTLNYSGPSNEILAKLQEYQQSFIKDFNLFINALQIISNVNKIANVKILEFDDRLSSNLKDHDYKNRTDYGTTRTPIIGHKIFGKQNKTEKIYSVHYTDKNQTINLLDIIKLEYDNMQKNKFISDCQSERSQSNVYYPTYLGILGCCINNTQTYIEQLKITQIIQQTVYEVLKDNIYKYLNTILEDPQKSDVVYHKEWFKGNEAPKQIEKQSPYSEEQRILAKTILPLFEQANNSDGYFEQILEL